MIYYLLNSDSIDLPSTIIFDFNLEFDSKEIREKILEFYEHNEQRNNVIYLYPENQELNHNQKNDLINIFKIDEINLYKFNLKGILEIDNNKNIEKSLQKGVVNLIKKNGVILQANENFHFVNPSKKHSTYFLRTGNLVKSSKEMFFIALCILDKLKGIDFKHIVCDSSSINQIATSLILLKKILGYKKAITIETFESYSGLSNFTFLPSTLVLISASNSGNLQKQIIGKTKELDLYFFTIIYNNKKDNNIFSLININPFFQDLLLIKSIEQYNSQEECKLCDKGSIPIEIRGEQFIQAETQLNIVIPRRPFVPSFLKNEFKFLIFCNSIEIHKRENLASPIRELFINFLSLNKNETFKNRFNKTILNHIPFSIDLIIHLNDESSKLASLEIYQQLNKFNSDLRKPISENHFDFLNVEDQEKLKTILIVSFCIRSGNKLNNISKKLRAFSKSNLHYLNIIELFGSFEDLKIFKSNLEYRQGEHFCENKVSSILSFYLPNKNSNRFNSYNKSIWSLEQKLYQNNEKNLPVYFRNRFERIKESRGLIDNELFFYNPLSKSALVLRENFALFDLQKETSLSQAELFFFFSSFFHSLRTSNSFKEVNENLLIQSDQIKSILDPETFSRFNDGIIHACILRCANPIELNYSDEKSSSKIQSILKAIFRDNSSEDEMESILEILFAIAIERLTFRPEHIQDFINSLPSRLKEAEEVNFLITIIEKSGPRK
ncbi:hypothetical protein [Algoriphagus marinus]|uniref:hypothetical protein n=1 Tax=Algoriphagus marinus TaxID=1925762 RepID=UPI00094BAE8D|nr:hypothetical protein [Algoriphagus marinus]